MCSCYTVCAHASVVVYFTLVTFNINAKCCLNLLYHVVTMIIGIVNQFEASVFTQI